MEKTYKFILPQNKEVEKTNIRIENGEVFVDVDFKEKFQPKDGDFCVDYFGNTFIVFEDGDLGINHGSYALFYKDNEKWYFKRNNMTRAVRFATPEEKAAFLARLEKECNKRWNPETKQIEDIRWRAEKGQFFYYVNGDLSVLSLQDSRGKVSDGMYKTGNYFLTTEAAQKVADQIKEIFKNSKVE